ncbi:hypothetical protein BU15DRAFT_63731 [Melanogaster broomeanus]|nr:hypothetical protein BU15DRAFT_63731 [Melanogaster broomeanus]
MNIYACISPLSEGPLRLIVYHFKILPLSEEHAKVTSNWTFQRYFSPLTCHSVFPPEQVISPPPLTQHKIFPREEEAEALIIQTQQSEPDVISPIPPSKVLIPKPRGEVSRINRGGYNLQDKLGLPPTEYEEIRSFVIHLAREYLTTRKSWSRQSREQLRIVFAKAKERYPQLLDYDGDWVVSDFLKMYLKNTSGRGA